MATQKYTVFLMARPSASAPWKQYKVHVEEISVFFATDTASQQFMAEHPTWAVDGREGSTMVCGGHV